MKIPVSLDTSEARMLSTLYAGLMLGVLVFTALVFGINQGSRGQVAEIPQHLRFMCYGVAGLAVLCGLLSRWSFRHLLSSSYRRHSRGEIDATRFKGGVRAAYLAKAALVEGPALLGLVTLLLIVTLPCDIMLAPRDCLLSLVPVAFFFLEMIRSLPTPSRLESVVQAMAIDEGVRPTLEDRP